MTALNRGGALEQGVMAGTGLQNGSFFGRAGAGKGMTFPVGRGERGVAVDLWTASLRPRQLRLVRVRLMAGKGKGKGVGARSRQGLEVKRQ
jgi:hypothetical protein